MMNNVAKVKTNTLKMNWVMTMMKWLYPFLYPLPFHFYANRSYEIQRRNYFSLFSFFFFWRVFLTRTFHPTRTVTSSTTPDNPTPVCLPMHCHLSTHVIMPIRELEMSDKWEMSGKWEMSDKWFLPMPAFPVSLSRQPCMYSPNA